MWLMTATNSALVHTVLVLWLPYKAWQWFLLLSGQQPTAFQAGLWWREFTRYLASLLSQVSKCCCWWLFCVCNVHICSWKSWQLLWSSNYPSFKEPENSLPSEYDFSIGSCTRVSCIQSATYTPTPLLILSCYLSLVFRFFLISPGFPTTLDILCSWDRAS